MKLWTLVLAAAMAVAGFNAQAARMGGGKSAGKQSGNVTQREAAAPAGGATQGAAAAKPAAPAAAAPPARPWGAMLGGLAAGLGLAWLAHSLGMGEAFGQMLMFGLLALGVMLAIGWFMRRRQASQAAGNASPFAFQGAGGAPVSDARPYKPENVGNDASARPWERANSAAFDAGTAVPGSGTMIGSALTGTQNWHVPADFDTEGFLQAAKGNFISLQAAWDKSDIEALRAMMTDAMLGEMKIQLGEREGHTGGPANHTEVVMIEAKLLGIEDAGDEYLASVEFSGMIREQPSAGPNPFREVWNMSKPKSGSAGWLVAGVQALQ